MKLGPCSFLLVMLAACGGAFTTPNDRDSGLGGTSAGTGGQAGGIAGGGGDLGGYAGLAGGYGGGGGDFGGAGGAGGYAGAGGVAGAAGSGGTGGSAGAAGKLDAGIDFGACDGPGQCILAPIGCCGVCGPPKVTDFVGIHRKYESAYQAQRCPIALPCPACASAPNPNLGARCVEGRCQVFDVQRVPEYSSCQSNGDCVLRNGVECCECGGDGWVAVSRTGGTALVQAMCAPNSACAGCAPVPPPALITTCFQNACSTTFLIP